MSAPEAEKNGQVQTELRDQRSGGRRSLDSAAAGTRAKRAVRRRASGSGGGGGGGGGSGVPRNRQFVMEGYMAGGAVPARSAASAAAAKVKLPRLPTIGDRIRFGWADAGGALGSRTTRSRPRDPTLTLHKVDWALNGPHGVTIVAKTSDGEDRVIEANEKVTWMVGYNESCETTFQKCRAKAFRYADDVPRGQTGTARLKKNTPRLPRIGDRIRLGWDSADCRRSRGTARIRQRDPTLILRRVDWALDGPHGATIVAQTSDGDDRVISADEKVTWMVGYNESYQTTFRHCRAKARHDAKQASALSSAARGAARAGRMPGHAGRKAPVMAAAIQAFDDDATDDGDSREGGGRSAEQSIARPGFAGGASGVDLDVGAGAMLQQPSGCGAGSAHGRDTQMASNLAESTYRSVSNSATETAEDDDNDDDDATVAYTISSFRANPDGNAEPHEHMTAAAAAARDLEDAVEGGPAFCSDPRDLAKSAAAQHEFDGAGEDALLDRLPMTSSIASTARAVSDSPDFAEATIVGSDRRERDDDRDTPPPKRARSGSMESGPPPTALAQAADIVALRLPPFPCRNSARTVVDMSAASDARTIHNVPRIRGAGAFEDASSTIAVDDSERAAGAGAPEVTQLHLKKLKLKCKARKLEVQALELELQIAEKQLQLQREAGHAD